MTTLTTLHKTTNKKDTIALFNSIYNDVPQSKNTTFKLDCSKLPFMNLVDAIHEFTHLHKNITLTFPPIKDDIVIFTMSWEQP